MAALGIPTSRALCLIASDEIVMREMPEKAAQIIRLAPSHLRFGTFEYFFYRKENDKVKILADYAIEQYFPEAKSYADFLENVVKSTARMIANWQAFGFCHGVLNTDNMSIHGITLDYGPFGFLDEYNPHHICNHSDTQGHYSFANQPMIGMWNLHAFAITLSSLITMEEQKKILESYEDIFLNEYHKIMAAKLGFEKVDAEVKKEIYSCLNYLGKTNRDYTNFFTELTDKTSDPQKKRIMEAVNPRFVLRNHLLQIAIEKAEKDDFSEVEKLQKICRTPFKLQEQYQEYYSIAPDWAKEICISCSS